MKKEEVVYYLKVFYPIIIIALGVTLLLLSGVNDVIGMNIFQAMKHVVWYGWIGLAMFLGGTVWMLIRG